MLTEPVAAKSSKCDKVNEELQRNDAKVDASSEHICKNFSSEADNKVDTELAIADEQVVKMEVDATTTFRHHADLTTTETMASVDELENEQADLEKALQQQCQEVHAAAESVKQKLTIKTVDSSSLTSSSLAASAQETISSLPINPDPDADTCEKPADTTAIVTNSNESPVTRTIAKITRSSLNGATRSPAMLKHLRKSTRTTRFKSKVTARNNATGGNGPNVYNGQNAGTMGHSMLGAVGNTKSHGKTGLGGAGNAARNRRTLFKRPAQKTPRMQASTKFVKSVFYKGSYMQLGDIVSIVDSEYNVYYAQVRGLLVDAYCEKSAFLTWLIPTQDSPDPNEGFDPATYLIGPDEELSRKLCYLEFVMHAPSNYYFDRTTPFPLPDADDYAAERAGGYIWTRMTRIKREKQEAKAHAHKAIA